MTALNKIYIDSRKKTTDSSGNGDFSIELPASYTFPENTYMTVGDVVIPVVWYSNEDSNNKLYIRINTSDFILAIDPQNYNIQTLASQIQTQLNSISSGLFNVSSSLTTNTISIAITNGGTSFRIFSSTEMQTNSINWNGPTYNKNNLQSFNAMLGNEDIHTTPTYNINNPYVSGFVNIANIHTIYIVCNEFLDTGNIGPRFENNIIKKIPVNAAYGFLVVHDTINEHDLIDVSRKTIRTLHFQVVDFYGNIIPFHGSHVSFTLFFRPGMFFETNQPGNMNTSGHTSKKWISLTS